MFGNHIGNAVFFEDGTGQNGGVVDTMGVNYVGFAVVCDIASKAFMPALTQRIRSISTTGQRGKKYMLS